MEEHNPHNRQLQDLIDKSKKPQKIQQLPPQSIKQIKTHHTLNFPFEP